MSKELATDGDRIAVFEALDQRWQERKQKNAETQAQQEIDRGQIKNKILDKNDPSVPENKPEELSRTHVVDHTTENWKWQQTEAIADVTQMLNDCEDAEALALLRRCEVPADIFRLAARQLPSEKREQIKQWVIEQNACSD